MTQVVHQLIIFFDLNKKLLPLFSEKEPDQLRLPDYVKVSYDRFYEIKTNIANNKNLAPKAKNASGKTIIIKLKDALDLIDQISENNITHNVTRTIFDDKIVNEANIITSIKPTDKRTKMLKIFYDLGEVFGGKFYDIKIVDGKYKSVKKTKV